MDYSRLSVRLPVICFSAFLSLFLLVSFAEAAAPKPIIKKDKIVNKNTGKQFVPRGVNWPSFEYACVDGWGYSHETTSSAHIRAMRRWKINVVRIPLNQDCWLAEDGLPAGGLSAGRYRLAVKRFVRTLNNQGIVAILDLHWSGERGLKATGLRAMPDSSSRRFWRSLASSFRSNRSVIFDIFNEPYSRWNDRTNSWAFELSWSCWARGGCWAPRATDLQAVGKKRFKAVGMNPLIKDIRSTGARQPIIVSGRDWANDLSGIARYVRKDSQLIAGFHAYSKQNCSYKSCWNKTLKSLKKKMPLLTTEVGQNNCGFDYTRNYISWADSKKVGYLVWAWWSIAEGCWNYALIQDWNGTPNGAYGRFYRSHLQRANR